MKTATILTLILISLVVILMIKTIIIRMSCINTMMGTIHIHCISMRDRHVTIANAQIMNKVFLIAHTLTPLQFSSNSSLQEVWRTKRYYRDHNHKHLMIAPSLLSKTLIPPAKFHASGPLRDRFQTRLNANEGYLRLHRRRAK